MLLELLVAASVQQAAALNNGMGRTPALGWSSWNYFENDINETVIVAIGQGMVSSGLHAAGYEFVNMDAGVWAPARSPAGKIMADRGKFPSGMEALAGKLHALGLKMGLYTDLSNRTVGKVCGTGPGSFGHFEEDAAKFAKLGADFLKVDYCAYDQRTSSKYHPPIHDQLSSWQQLRDALNKTNRPIYSYFCPRSFHGSLEPPDPATGDCGGKRCIYDGPPHSWDGPTRKDLANTILTEYGNSGDSWESAMSNLDALLDLRPKPDIGGPGFFSDGDMLHTCTFGHGKKGKVGMSQQEYTAQFATYAVLASPIVISADLRAGSVLYTEPRGKACLDGLLKNKAILDVHQDPAAHAPVMLNDSNRTMGHGFARKMADGSVAVIFLNRQQNAPLAMSTSWDELGLPDGKVCAVRDLINGKDLPKATGRFGTKVASHSASLVRIRC